MSATSSSALVIGGVCHRTRTKFATPSRRGIFDRSDQINQNSRAVAVSLRGTDQTSSEASLYDVERSGRFASEDAGAAKLALYCATIFYGWNWWSRSGSNRRPEACKATALPTELRPHSIFSGWWARVDSNYRPYAYQASAQTTRAT